MQVQVKAGDDGAKAIGVFDDACVALPVFQAELIWGGAARHCRYEEAFLVYAIHGAGDAILEDDLGRLGLRQKGAYYPCVTRRHAMGTQGCEGVGTVASYYC